MMLLAMAAMRLEEFDLYYLPTIHVEPECISANPNPQDLVGQTAPVCCLMFAISINILAP